MANAELEQLSSEQAQDLAALEMGVAESPMLPGEEEPQDPAETLGEEIAGIVLSLAAVLSPALPSIRKIYTPETTKAAGAAIAAVCVKHGWLSGGVMGEWSEEISAAIILLPLGVATYQGVKSDVAELKAKALPAGKAPEKIAPLVTPQTVQTGAVSMPEVESVAGVSFGTPHANV
jgi:hypothetical protein